MKRWSSNYELQDPVLLQRKLDHYNEWLLDPKRPILQKYPGFPDEHLFDKKPVENQDSQPVQAPVKSKPVKEAKGSRFLQAKAIFEVHKDKDQFIRVAMEEMQISKSNASIYFKRVTQ